MIDTTFLNVTAPTSAAPVVATTSRLLEICGAMDAQALGYAITGFTLSILALFYFGRVRAWLLLKGEDTLIAFGDKFLLVLIALSFAAVIVRLMRAG